MRRRSTRLAAAFGVLASALAGVLVAPAAVPPVVVRPSTVPRGLEAGQEWTLTLRVTRRGRAVAARPRLEVRGPSRFTRPASVVRSGLYSARLAFPTPGAWVVRAVVAGRSMVVARARVVVPVSPLAGWRAIRVCGGMGSPQPQFAVTLDAAGAWVACPARSSLVHVDAGLVASAPVRTRAYPWSVAAAGGRLWLAGRTSTLARFDPVGQRTSTALTGAGIPYVWSAAGSVWVADDGGRQLVRLDPATGSVAGRFATGDGPSDVVSDGSSLWVINHRDGSIDRIDLASGLIARLARVAGDAPERLELAFGSLWVTGRGTDLHRLDPATGAQQAVLEVGAGAIDLAAAASALLVAVPTDADDRRGLPVLDRLLRVDPATNAVAATVRPTAPVMVNGLVSDGRRAWLADVANGRLLVLD